MSVISFVGARPQFVKAAEGSARNVRRLPSTNCPVSISPLRGAAALLMDSRGNRLVAGDESRSVAETVELPRPSSHPDVDGDGHAAQAIVGALDARCIS
jgi:hypothetical protein